MDLDMSEICGVFLEESTEGLDAMESGLLAMQPGAVDAEVINTIFRAAHSIKGGAATLGFDAVADFTHGVETLMDEMRGGTREVTKDAIELLLECVDCIRAMLTASQDDGEFDTARTQALKTRIDTMLNGEELPSNVFVFNQDMDEEDDDLDMDESASEWMIGFKPKKSFFISGHDPLAIFHELQSLGELKVESNTAWLPSFDDMDPELCYLSWDLTLKGQVDRGSIRKLFAAVEEQCDLEIKVKNDALDIASAIENYEEGEQEEEEMVFVDALEMQMNAAQASTDDKQSKPAEAEKPITVADKVVTDKKDKQIAQQKKPSVNTAKPAKAAESIRVGTDKIDKMINMVGELVITQSMLSRFNEGVDESQLDDLRKGLMQLTRNTRELQESVMQIRMLPVSVVFSRFPRLVHDISGQLGKKVELKLTGENTELDKTVLEKIGDPLVHLVRNSLDHGLETPEERKSKGKPETGTLQLNAYHAGGNIVLEVRDDGAGLNKERILEKARERGLVSDQDELSDDQINNLIFRAGFSTAEQVNNLSGRGVGMDVVKRNIAELGGHVYIQSEEGHGCLLTIRLPLTLAILDGQLVRVGSQCYIIPLVSIVESIQVKMDRVSSLAGTSELYKLREEYIPIIRLYEIFNIQPDTEQLSDGLLVVVEGGGERVGILVDELQEQQQVVIKSLEANYKQIKGLSGATILGDGEVALIIDMAGLVQKVNERDKNNKLRSVA